MVLTGIDLIDVMSTTVCQPLTISPYHGNRFDSIDRNRENDIVGTGDGDFIAISIQAV
jgi:hypothetical protein